MSRAIVQGAAPFFKGSAWCHVNQKIKQLSLNDYKDKYVVLFFYPLNFTFVCPTEIIEFSKKAADFRKIHTEVIGCSVDSVHSHRTFIQQSKSDGGLGGLDIDLLSDSSHQISKDYGVLVPEAGIALRGTFIIDPKMVIRHLSINDVGVGRYKHFGQNNQEFEAFQFNDKHGEVCPAKWKKGGATINTAKPEEYWKTHHMKE